MSAKALKWITPLALMLLVGCSESDERAAAMTEDVGDGVFQNDRFGMTVEKPEDWYAQSFEEMIQAHQMGADILSGDDENMRASIENALETTLPLFSFYKRPPGTPTEFNPSVMALAENVGIYSAGIETGCDYLGNMVQIMNQSQMQFETDGGCSTTEVNGETFGVQTISISAGPSTVHQRYLACLNGDHAIGIIQSYQTDEHRDDVDNVLDSLEIACDSSG